MNPLKPQSPFPITIRIAYEWTDRRREPSAALPDARCDFIQSAIESVVREVEKRVASRKGVRPLYVRVGRMRARHGAELLPRFRELCIKTDIIAVDITGDNPNVMLELGMALGARDSTIGRIFVFKQKTVDGSDIPGDLKGYCITFFQLERGPKKGWHLSLSEPKAFRASLRTSIIELARERGMWGEKGLVEEEDGKAEA